MLQYFVIVYTIMISEHFFHGSIYDMDIMIRVQYEKLEITFIYFCTNIV